MLPWIYSLIALKSLGYPLDHPVIARGLEGIENFITEDDSTFLLQPAVSPVWDTAWSVLSLQESGLDAEHPALIRAAKWLLDKEIRFDGDWKVKNPDTEPGGWSFEFENQWYPDLDDSAIVPQSLRKLQLPGDLKRHQELANERALNWIVDMQSKDGGWAAFDRDNDKAILDHIPFADFMSPLDPTCPDVTAHILEFLSEFDQSDAHRQRAISYIKSSQEDDGAWYGRWGVNYLYGTGLVLAGLGVAGEDPGQPYIQRAIAWLTSRQNPDGGWGETCQTYDNPDLRGVGPSTASQTAWALIGLLAIGESSNPSVTKGFEYLLRTQTEDGIWHEDAYTGTGFPGLFYLRYDLYRIYFPLLALARYKYSITK
jgi:squalene-hopene/tetraprenyl-beta-curcumene cyclase